MNITITFSFSCHIYLFVNIDVIIILSQGLCLLVLRECGLTYFIGKNYLFLLMKWPLSFTKERHRTAKIFKSKNDFIIYKYFGML